MMKNVLTLLLALLFLGAFAQEGFHYQGVLRDGNGQLMPNAELDLRFRLIADRDQPNLFDFEEEHQSISTDQFGVFSVTIGSEDPSAFTSIDFSRNYFLEVSVRTNDQLSFQLLHRDRLTGVPYAMHAITAEHVDDADADPTNEMQELIFDPATQMLQISGGNAVQIPTGVTDADADPTNELQRLGYDPLTHTLSISDGNEIELPMDGTDADDDPTNELQQISKNGHKIILSDGGEVVDDVEDADADPENELQFLDFDEQRGELSISGGNSITLPFQSGPDGDDDPENELQRLSLLGNGKLILSHGGGEVALNQSPLIPTTDTRGRFAFRLNQKLAINKNRPDASAELDVDGIIRTSTLQTNDINVPVNQQGIGQLFIRDELGRHMASFTGQVSNGEPNLYVDQVRIGRGTVRLHSPKTNSGEFWVTKEGKPGKMMRIGETTSAISTKDLFINEHLHIYHPSRADGQTGLSLLNTGGNGNRWNMYVANGNGRLELYHKGVIKGRFMPNDGSYVKNSDVRLKSNIEDISAVLERISALRPKSYYFKDDESKAKKSLGFIAQDVRELFPDLVQEGTDGENPYLSLNYDGFSVIAIKAIQEQQEVIQTQKKELADIKQQLEDLRLSFKKLMQTVSDMPKK